MGPAILITVAMKDSKEMVRYSSTSKDNSQLTGQTVFDFTIALSQKAAPRAAALFAIVSALHDAGDR